MPLTVRQRKELENSRMHKEKLKKAWDWAIFIFTFFGLGFIYGLIIARIF